MALSTGAGMSALPPLSEGELTPRALPCPAEAAANNHPVCVN
jgi:hypothetical protein